MSSTLNITVFFRWINTFHSSIYQFPQLDTNTNVITKYHILKNLNTEGKTPMLSSFIFGVEATIEYYQFLTNYMVVANQHQQLTCVCYNVYPVEKNYFNVNFSLLIFTVISYVACLFIPQPSLANCKRLAGLSLHKLKDCAYNKLKQNDKTKQR